MNNIVDFRTGRSRPRRSILVSQGDAQILFFTGVRYSRESEGGTASLSPEPALLRDASEAAQQLSSEAAFNLAAH